MIPDGTLVLTDCPGYPTFHNKVCRVVGKSSDHFNITIIKFYLDYFGEHVPFYKHELIILTQAQYYLYS